MAAGCFGHMSLEFYITQEFTAFHHCILFEHAFFGKVVMPGGAGNFGANNRPIFAKFASIVQVKINCMSLGRGEF